MEIKLGVKIRSKDVSESKGEVEIIEFRIYSCEGEVMYKNLCILKLIKDSLYTIDNYNNKDKDIKNNSINKTYKE